jgi:hypothetical protein
LTGLDRAIQYSRDGCDGIEKPQRTGYPLEPVIGSPKARPGGGYDGPSQALRKPAPLPADQTDFARRANQFVFCQSACPAPFAKIFSFAPNPNQFTESRRPVPIEGRFAIVTNAGRDAVDAAARETNADCCVRRSRVVLTPRSLASSFAEFSA